MKDFLLNLYSNDNFILYLTISICVLIMLFVIVYVFGKKDPAKEKVKKTKKHVIDGFKQNKNEEKIEIKKDKIEDEEKLINHEEVPILPINNEEIKSDDIATVYKPEDKSNTPDVNEVQADIKIETPVVDNNVDFQKELGDFRKLQAEYNKLRFDTLMGVEKGQIGEETPYQASPSIKIAIEDEEKEISNDIKVEDEEEFDMPQLKTNVKSEDKQDTPVQTENNKPKTFDELFGETYNIQK